MADNTEELKPEETSNEPEFVTPEAVAAEAESADDSAQLAPVEKPEESTVEPSQSLNKFKRLLKSYWTHKKWSLPATVLTVLLILLAVPFTRYELLGLFLKGNVSVTVRDSKTASPVSGATVSLAGKQFKTDGNGKITASVKLGTSTLATTKQYFSSASQPVTVTFSKQHNSFAVSLVATGRQVPIKVINKITGKPLASALISVLGTESKTDKNGQASIVLPTTKSTQPVVLNLDGYNKLATNIQVTDKVVAANTFSLTPAGKLYFLSNQSGKIDVVKTNLDGTDRQVVLAGTGKEDPNSTSLLAARDWKYLALLSRRSGDDASVYVLDTSNDKLTTVDEGAADFSLVGWSDDTFIYQVGRRGVQNWESKGQALKSYNAPSSKLVTIDETVGEGSSPYDYGFNQFSGVYILDNELVYAKNWYSSYYTNHLDGKSVSLVSSKPDGSGKKTVRDFAVPSGTQYNYYIGLSLYEPYGVYVEVPASGASQPTYFEYEDGKLQAKPDVTTETFNKPYPTYLISPSGKNTLWTDQRDGKNTLFLGDKDAGNEKQIASLSGYTQYGWYGDEYILVSKNSSELYIMSASGSDQTPKITDYYKPPVNYRGYGGGYGGI